MHLLLVSFVCTHKLLSDNGAEFHNGLVAEICSQYNIKQTFTVTYHPASSGLVERAKRKILDALRPVVNSLHGNWDDWLSHIAACINSSVSESTGKPPHYILYGADILANPQKPVYNTGSYAKQYMHVFTDIHTKVRLQHKRAVPVTIKVGSTVIVRLPERNSKLSPKFIGSRLVVRQLHDNKFEVHVPLLNIVDVVHSDWLKKTRVQTNPSLVDCTNLDNAIVRTTNTTPTDIASHRYNLRSSKNYCLIGYR